MMILTPLIGGGALAALFGVRRLGLLVSVLAILVSFCLRPGYMATLMSADSALTAAQHSWLPPGDIAGGGCGRGGGLRAPEIERCGAGHDGSGGYRGGVGG